MRKLKLRELKQFCPGSPSTGHKVPPGFYLDISLWASTVKDKSGERTWPEAQKSILSPEKELNEGEEVTCDKPAFRHRDAGQRVLNTPGGPGPMCRS